MAPQYKPSVPTDPYPYYVRTVLLQRVLSVDAQVHPVRIIGSDPISRGSIRSHRTNLVISVRCCWSWYTLASHLHENRGFVYPYLVLPQLLTDECKVMITVITMKDVSRLLCLPYLIVCSLSTLGLTFPKYLNYQYK